MPLLQEQLIGKVNRYLSILCNEIEGASSMNLNNLAVVSEDFFRDLLNQIYKKNGLNLITSNRNKCNFPAIDLDDKNLRLSYQITASCKGAKIKHTLEVFDAWPDKSAYEKLIFLFIEMSFSPKLKKKYEGQKGGYAVEIFDICSLLKEIQALSLDELQEVHDFIAKSTIPEHDGIDVDAYLFRQIFKILIEGIEAESEHQISDGYVSNLNLKKEKFSIYWDDLRMLYASCSESGSNFDDQTLFMKYDNIIKTCFSNRLTKTNQLDLERYLQAQSIILLQKNDGNPINAIDALADHLQERFKIIFVPKTMILNFLLNMFFACDVFPIQIKK